jgi:hypothetical protein
VVWLTPYFWKPFLYNCRLFAAPAMVAVTSKTGRDRINSHLAAIPKILIFVLFLLFKFYTVGVKKACPKG